MPIHNWTRVAAGIFHAFHHDWITQIARALNHGLLPPEYYALPEQVAGRFGPDVLTLSRPIANGSPAASPSGSGIALATTPPKVRFRLQSEDKIYAAKAKAVVVRHVSDHAVIALVELVSPGNKSSRQGLNAFVRKANETLAAGIHLLIVDLFPPGKRDLLGIHRAVWGDDPADEFVAPPNKPLTCVAYIGGPAAGVFLEPTGVGDILPEMPLFLTPDEYIPVPLEATYQAAWEGLPAYWRDVLTSGGSEPASRGP